MLILVVLFQGRLTRSDKWYRTNRNDLLIVAALVSGSACRVLAQQPSFISRLSSSEYARVARVPVFVKFQRGFPAQLRHVRALILSGKIGITEH